MEFEIEYIKEFIAKHKGSKVILGVDSQRIKKKGVKYATVVIVHYDGCHGAKIFADVTYEKTKDAKLSRPFNRMMREVALISDLYTLLEDVLIDVDFEIHIDVNPKEGTGSNVAYNAAKGYIWGVVGVEPICKPDAWGASCAADRFSK